MSGASLCLRWHTSAWQSAASANKGVEFGRMGAQVTFASRAERGREDPRAERLLRRWSAGTPRPQSPHPAPHRPHPRPAPACAPAKDPQHQHGLLHRERVLQAGRRHPRHPAGRSWRQRSGGQNPELSIFKVAKERWMPRPLRSDETSLPCL
uniref:neurogranin isoform X1 n=1 Tax=Halichoerus grypus TaxID=9711 RepID=UPI0016598FC5|nr:neurogranin isoform X1 [Halichoerus grypus]